MRYWIWWNDLAQGPFELDELVCLRAFSEDLLVCMEDREEWIPAGRVADLSSAIEQLRARRSAPLAPAPPPPKRHPSVTPLQGEFFSEAPNQESLIEPEEGPKGPFAFKRADELTESSAQGPPYLMGRVTMPFHFAKPPKTQTQTQTRTAVIELPAPKPSFEPRADQPKIVMPVTFSAPKSSAIAKVEITEPAVEKVPLRLVASEIIEPPQTKSFATESLEDINSSEIRLRWLPWILGVAVALAALGTASNWLLDHTNTRSAIAEAKRLEPQKPLNIPGPSPLPLPTPIRPSHAPIRDWIPPPIEDLAQPAAKRAVKRDTLHKGPTHRIAAKAVPSEEKPNSSGASNDRRSPRPARVASIDSASALVPGVDANASKNSGHTVDAAPSDGAVSASSVEPLNQKVRVPDTHPERPSADVSPVKPTTPLTAPESGMGAAAEILPKPATPDPWTGRQTEAINLVTSYFVPHGKMTIGRVAAAMLGQMHEKELIRAAETGERLYLPDKISWAALREEGPRYRVYLNFLAMQASGERVQSRSYQFSADLSKKAVSSDDVASQEDILSQTGDMNFKHNPMAVDIESILGGVDYYNKQKMRSMIVKNNRRNKDEQKNIVAAMAAAKDKVRKAIAFFRKTYTETALKNVAKAYEFTEIL